MSGPERARGNNIRLKDRLAFLEKIHKKIVSTPPQSTIDIIKSNSNTTLDLTNKIREAEANATTLADQRDEAIRERDEAIDQSKQAEKDGYDISIAYAFRFALVHATRFYTTSGTQELNKTRLEENLEDIKTKVCTNDVLYQLHEGDNEYNEYKAHQDFCSSTSTATPAEGEEVDAAGAASTEADNSFGLF